MSSDSLLVAGNYSTYNTTTSKRDGVKTPSTLNLRMPQNTTTEDFKAYLQQYEPETYKALQYFANKYPQKQLTDEEREQLNHTTLKAFRPPSAQTCGKAWKVVKSLFTKVKPDDIQDGYDKLVAIQDTIDKINKTNTNINIRPFA